MDLDDGVMVNSAALWPLLEPQWKEPKKWWKELATAQGKKDYDWSHLAARYFPTRVDAKCQQDPSLGVAHGCFWRYHPARAWAWELRLQDEIGPDFRIEEPPYRPGDGDRGDGGHSPARLLPDHPEAPSPRSRRRPRRLDAARAGGSSRDTDPRAGSLVGPRLGPLGDGATSDREARRPFRHPRADETEARAAYEAGHPDRVRDAPSFSRA